jgi:hypothetical protein
MDGMTITLTPNEAELLIACLAHLEQIMLPDTPMTHALADLRSVRSQLIQEWLSARHGHFETHGAHCQCSDCRTQSATDLVDSMNELGKDGSTREKPRECPICGGNLTNHSH